MYTGDPGLNGLPGAVGPIGARGRPGIPGSNGAKGQKGEKGMSQVYKICNWSYFFMIVSWQTIFSPQGRLHTSLGGGGGAQEFRQTAVCLAAKMTCTYFNLVFSIFFFLDNDLLPKYKYIHTELTSITEQIQMYYYSF